MRHMSLTWFYHVSQQVSTHVHGRGIVPIEVPIHYEIDVLIKQRIKAISHG